MEPAPGQQRGRGIPARRRPGPTAAAGQHDAFGAASGLIRSATTQSGAGARVPAAPARSPGRASGGPQLHALYEELAALGPAYEPRPPDPAEVALRIELDYRGAELCFVNTITTFGTAFDITLDEIAVEAYLPAGLETRRYFGTGRNTGELPGTSTN